MNKNSIPNTRCTPGYGRHSPGVGETHLWGLAAGVGHSAPLDAGVFGGTVEVDVLLPIPVAVFIVAETTALKLKENLPRV